MGFGWEPVLAELIVTAILETGYNNSPHQRRAVYRGLWMIKWMEIAYFHPQIH